jgi:hypothetical protein
LCQTLKIYERILVLRKSKEELYAFRRKRTTTDLIFGIRQLIEKNWEYGKELVMIFIGYKKVFDTMRRGHLEKFGKTRNFNRSFKESENTYEKTIKCVKTNKGLRPDRESDKKCIIININEMCNKI